MTARPDTTDDDARLARAEGLVASEVEGEMVILSIDSGHFFHLNATGSRIWELLGVPMTMAEICEKASEGFAVDPEACRRDIAEFVQGMRAKGLLRSA